MSFSNVTHKLINWISVLFAILSLPETQSFRPLMPISRILNTATRSQITIKRTNNHVLFAAIPNKADSLKAIKNNLKSSPDNENLLFSYGTLLMEMVVSDDKSITNKEDSIDEALDAFERVISINPNSDSAWFNIAAIYENYFDDKYEEANQAYVNTLSTTSNRNLRYASYNNIIALQLRFGDFEAAERFCNSAVNEFPDSSLMWCTTGIVFRENKNFELAKMALEKSLDLLQAKSETESEDDVNILLTILSNLGFVYISMNDNEKAFTIYKRAAEVNPTDTSFLQNLAQLYADNNQTAEALDMFNRVLELEPNNMKIKFLIAALKGSKEFQSAPKEYIRELFDYYADVDYDGHMINSLKYKGPVLIWDAIKRAATKLKVPFDKFLTDGKTIEIGTGTGLVGSQLRQENYFGIIDGSDISENMIAVASTLQFEVDAGEFRNVYDSLVIDDCNAYLKSTADGSYDVALAGDVLCYFGDLKEVLGNAKLAVKPKTGLVVFTVELLPENHPDPFTLQNTSRYAHKKSYVENTAKTLQYNLADIQQATLRMNGEVPVTGLVVALQRP